MKENNRFETGFRKKKENEKKKRYGAYNFWIVIVQNI